MQLCYDIVAKVAPSVPRSVVTVAINHVAESVRYRCGFDLHDVAPAAHAATCGTPTLVVHGAQVRSSSGKDLAS